ncbi:hypothetical protein MIMGU_mgv1a023062mg, partial [Erythranthe guttata]
MAAKKHLKRGTPVLPQEIIQIILSNLPPNSLLRFKTVSKSWYTIISDPLFIQTHLCSSLSESNSFAKSQDPESQPVKLLEGPCGEYDVMSFCGCVLLLVEANISLKKRLVLWDPCTRTETYVWSPDICSGRQSYGLCYDRTSRNFKVVALSLETERYVVYSSRNRSWTKRHGFPGSGKPDTSAPGVYVNGAIYWVWRRSYNKIVIRFRDSTRFVNYDPFKNTFEEFEGDASCYEYEFVPYVH